MVWITVYHTLPQPVNRHKCLQNKAFGAIQTHYFTLLELVTTYGHVTDITCNIPAFVTVTNQQFPLGDFMYTPPPFFSIYISPFCIWTSVFGAEVDMPIKPFFRIVIAFALLPALVPIPNSNAGSVKTGVFKFVPAPILNCPIDIILHELEIKPSP